MSEIKTISYDTYLKALGVLTMAKHHNALAVQFAKLLEEILEVPEDNRIGNFWDAAFGDPNDTLDKALKKEGYVVEPPPTRSPEGETED